MYNMEYFENIKINSLNSFSILKNDSSLVLEILFYQ